MEAGLVVRVAIGESAAARQGGTGEFCCEEQLVTDFRRGLGWRNAMSQSRRTAAEETDGGAGGRAGRGGYLEQLVENVVVPLTLRLAHHTRFLEQVRARG